MKVGEAMIATNSAYGRTNRAIRYVQSVDSRFFTDNVRQQWSFDGGTYPKKDREKHQSVVIRHAAVDEVNEVMEEFKRNKLIDSLRHARWEGLSTVDLEAVKSLVEKAI